MKGERENQTVIPIPQRWGNTQSVCAAMEDKDVLGKIDCVNGESLPVTLSHACSARLQLLLLGTAFKWHQ